MTRRRGKYSGGRPILVGYKPIFNFPRFGDTAMPKGKVKKLTDKGFGFIATDGDDLFFHMSNLEGVEYEDLEEGREVEFEIGQGPKGKRAEHVKPVN